MDLQTSILHIYQPWFFYPFRAVTLFWLPFWWSFILILSFDFHWKSLRCLIHLGSHKHFYFFHRAFRIVCRQLAMFKNLSHYDSFQYDVLGRCNHAWSHCTFSPGIKLQMESFTKRSRSLHIYNLNINPRVFEKSPHLFSYRTIHVNLRLSLFFDNIISFEASDWFQWSFSVTHHHWSLRLAEQVSYLHQIAKILVYHRRDQVLYILDSYQATISSKDKDWTFLISCEISYQKYQS